MDFILFRYNSVPGYHTLPGPPPFRLAVGDGLHKAVSQLMLGIKQNLKFWLKLIFIPNIAVIQGPHRPPLRSGDSVVSCLVTFTQLEESCPVLAGSTIGDVISKMAAVSGDVTSGSGWFR